MQKNLFSKKPGNSSHLTISNTAPLKPKTYHCSSCLTTFRSQSSLDNHARTKCVRKESSSSRNRVSSAGKHLSQKTKKGLPSTPKKAELSPSRLAAFKITCEICSKSFIHGPQFIRHKVVEHGMETPDKTMKSAEAGKIRTPNRGHGGVPPNSKLKRAMENFRKNLAQQ